MASLSINLRWHKDQSGYRLVRKGSLPDGNPPADRIVPNGGERVSIHPMETPDLYLVFSKLDSSEKLLAFVERFGLLGDDGVEYEVDACLDCATIFREALRKKAEGPEQLAVFLESSE